METRLASSEDMNAIGRIAGKTELFPPEMLPEMASDFLNNSKSNEIWLVCEDNNEVIGFCYTVPEELTDGTWNMLALAVDPASQGSGAGSAIVSELERILSNRKQRLLIVDTSGTDAFSLTREFYSKNEYEEEARIRDYWAANDDKITFRKAL
ncbi:MAG: GNAT family N-acetyltransferase [Pseudomonadota bacterium]